MGFLKRTYNGRKIMKRSDSKGMSRAVTIFLIIFIILLAVTYIVVKNVILKGSEERALGKYTLNLEISKVQKINDSTLSVTVKRNVGDGTFVGINFIVEDEKKIEIVQVNGSLNELESKNFLLPLTAINSSDVNRVSIEPIFKFGSKTKVGGNIEAKYTINSSNRISSTCIPHCPAEAQCGSDGCDGICGSVCQQGYICSSYTCIITLEEKCLRANVTVTKVVNITPLADSINYNSTIFNVTLLRQGGEDIIWGVKLIFTNESESPNLVIDAAGDITPFESVYKSVTILESYLTNPSKIRTIVYFRNESDGEINQALCDPSVRIPF